ncbi:MAG: winged helix DNA-binding domain-containing protein [bacterium]
MIHTTQPQVAAFRLRRHHLIDQNPANLIIVCRNVCGMQAQVAAAAELQFRARIHDLNRTEIQAALWENRTLVKTSLMRQTLHIIPAEDFSIYITALKKSRLASLWHYRSKFGITQKEGDRLDDLVLELLADGPMPQREVAERILPKVGKSIQKYMELAWSIQLFRHALVEGLICYGPEQRKRATFVRVDRWLPEQKSVSEYEAKQILLRRYLRAYGPATARDFAKWAGFPGKEAEEVWRSLSAELAEVSIDGQKASVLREDVEQLTNSNPGKSILRLLPHFDPYLLAHVGKDHLVAPAHYKKVYRKAGWIFPVVLLDGRVIGVWSYKRRGKRLSLELEPFENFSKTIYTAIEKETASLGRFLEIPVEIIRKT